MKKTLLTLIILFSLNSFSQKSKSTKIGNISLEELKMTTYAKDTVANAVVLYEHGNHYIDEDKDYKKTTDFYSKIKILKKSGANKAIIKIPFYDKAKVYNIKGITYNLIGEKIKKINLLDKDIFTKKLNGKWQEIRFTLPDIKAGSVIEYAYTITSPYSRIKDWHFQSDIPKAKSDFTASILGNWEYNIRSVGFLKLNRNEASIKKRCHYIPGLGNGDCLTLSYGMDNIPAFKKEKYMLSKENFISKIAFELKSFTNPDGRVRKYTKTWKDADRNLKNNFLDNQSSKKNFFKKELSQDILLTENEHEKANKIFKFIQNHFTWNDKYWPSKKVRIKDAFKEKTGTIFDINLSLYNSLQAANIKSYLVLTSTRSRAVPTRLHPVVNDFNYLLVKVIINNKTYFLDATHKFLPFGLIRYNALNGDGRVMDFKKGSYWETIQQKKRTSRIIKAQLEVNKDDELKGDIVITTKGYFAINDREKLNNEDNKTHIENFESKHPLLEVENFEHTNLEKNDETLYQIYSINFEDFENEGKLKINPFLIKRHTKNPFKLNDRDYPVDFGYPRSENYILRLKLPENYKINNLPESKAISLPNKGGKFILNFKNINNTINVYSKIVINKKVYSSDEYHYLKEFYNQIIKAQDVFIEIEKVND